MTNRIKAKWWDNDRLITECHQCHYINVIKVPPKMPPEAALENLSEKQKEEFKQGTL